MGAKPYREDRVLSPKANEEGYKCTIGHSHITL